MFVRQQLKFRAGLLAAAFGLVGCGVGGESPGLVVPEGDTKLVANVVDDFAEATQDPRVVETLFVKGAAPTKATLKPYAKYFFQPTGVPTIDGETATVEVTLRDETTSNDAGTQTWTFKKEADGWKIEKAPLP